MAFLGHFAVVKYVTFGSQPKRVGNPLRPRFMGVV